MLLAEMIAGLRAEAVRYDAAAKQQDHMAQWTMRHEPGALSRSRGALFREAASTLSEFARQYGGLAPVSAAPGRATPTEN